MVSSPSSPSPRRVAALLFAVAWGTNHFVPLLIVYRAHLALSSVKLGVLFGVYAVGLVPGLLFGGPLSDRLGRRAVVLPASALALAGTCVLAGGAAGFGVLLAGRFVVGLGAGATFSAGTAWVQDLAGGLGDVSRDAMRSETRGVGARRAAVALSSGFGGGPLITGVLAQWLPWPMQLPYGVHASVLVVCIAAVGLSSMPEGQAPRPPDGLTAERQRGVPKGFVAVAVAAPWVFVFPSIAHAVLPSLVRTKLGAYSVVFAGIVTGTTLLAGVLVQPLLRPCSPRSAGMFGLWVGALGVACGAIAAKALSPAGVVAAAVLLGAGYGGCLIAGLRFIENSATAATRGRLTGLYYAFSYIGFAAPLVLAAIGRRIGDVASLVVVLVLCAMTIAWTEWKARSRRAA